MANPPSVRSCAIGRLIDARCRELGLSRAELIRRTGQKNVSKGLRRLDALMAGDLSGAAFLIAALPRALAVPAATVEAAVAATREQLAEGAARAAAVEEQAWRAAFRPHGIILTERSVPSPIFAAAMVGVERLLRIDLDQTRPPDTFVRQRLDKMPPFVTAFGKPVGLVVDDEPDRAVRYDLDGTDRAILPRAWRVGEAHLTLQDGRPLPSGILG